MAIPQQCAEQPHYGRGTWTRTREMAGSKPAALPLGYTPIKYKGAFVRQRALLYENKNACQQNKKINLRHKIYLVQKATLMMIYISLS